MANSDLDQAAYLWGQGMEKIFEFAIKADSLVGKGDDSVEKLAKRLRRDRSTIENYAKGGALWKAMLEQKPSEAELIRDELDITFWNVVGRLYKNGTLSLDGAHHWLREAIDNKMTVKELTDVLPNRPLQSTMVSKAVKLVEYLETEIIIAPAFDISDKEYAIIRRASVLLVKILRKVTGMNALEMLIKEGIAKNNFQAAHIANGLRFAECNEAEQVKRAKLYRDWRNSKIYGKETAPCYEKAIAGEAVPVTPMFEGVMHSE